MSRVITDESRPGGAAWQELNVDSRTVEIVAGG
jgi:hypothetical protein